MDRRRKEIGVAKKGQRERIVPAWDFAAWLLDTAALSLPTQAIWLAWLAALYDPAVGGMATKTVAEWSRLGRCTPAQAQEAFGELRQNAVCVVRFSRRCADLVTVMSRRVSKLYKIKEDNRLRQERRRMSRENPRDVTKMSQNAFPTVRKKALGKDRSITRNRKKDFGKTSVSGSVENVTSNSPSVPIPNPITKDDVWSHPDAVRLAAAICGEETSRLTLNTFRKRWKAIGDRAFRHELASFHAELMAGERPARPGAALTERLTKLMEAADIRSAAQASLDAAPSAAACRHCGGTGTIRDVPVPEGDFAEGGRRDLPCGFCAAGQREMERQGIPAVQQQELVRHEMAALRVAPGEFAGRT